MLRDNATNNHDTGKICMDEIRRCFESSPTSLPVFIHLAFDRYGWIPVPSDISFSNFKRVNERCTSEEEKSILSDCYNHDSNAIPPCYRLKQLDRIPNWAVIEPKLRAILLREPEVQNKLISMTEQEVQFAIELDPSRVIVITKKSSESGRPKHKNDEDESYRAKQSDFVRRTSQKIHENNLLALEQDLKDDMEHGSDNLLSFLIILQTFSDQ